MAIISSGGIKRDGSSSEIKLKVDAKVQEIRRPANPRVTKPSRLPQNGGLDRKSSLQNNRDVAKTPMQKANNEAPVNPVKKAEQNRRPFNPKEQARVRDKDKYLDNEDGDKIRGNRQGTGTNSGIPKTDDLSENPNGEGLVNNDNNLDSENEEQEKNNDLDDGGVPKEADDGKAEQGGGVRNKLWKFIKKHPVVLIYAALALLAFILIFFLVGIIVVILGGSAANEEEYKKNYGPFFAFSNTDISIVDPTGQTPLSRRSLSLGEYVKGVVYLETMNMDLSGLSDEQLLEFYKALIVAKKAEILKKGGYNNKTKSITLKVNDFNHCDIDMGCSLVTKNGYTFYLSNSMYIAVDSTNKTIDPLDATKRAYLNQAYNLTVSEIVTPSSVKEPLTEYKWQAPNVTNNTVNSMLSNAKNGTSYDKIISGLFSGYVVYNLDNYVDQFESVYVSSFSHWWPIGSQTPDASGSYGDDPASIRILSTYGPSFTEGTINKGIKIAGSCNDTKVIASKDGRVSYVGYSEKYGHYLIVEHDDNIKTLYGSLASGSIRVSANQKVSQGDLLALVGQVSENDECHLYFEVYANGMNVNPLEYVSNENTRPNAVKLIKFVQGSDNIQTVCKTFLASGFSKNATAGLMANIDNESGFKLDDLSDGGTSNGLFQWHKGRLDNLKKYCGNTYLSSISCQLDFFLYEITITPDAQGGIYNYLMGNHSAYDMGYQFCIRFERPADMEVSADKRGKLAESKYVSYVNNGCN